MRFNVKMRWPERGFIEFLWKLVATVVVFGIIGTLTASHAESASALQGFSYFVVGGCAFVGVVSTISRGCFAYLAVQAAGLKRHLGAKFKLAREAFVSRRP